MTLITPADVENDRLREAGEHLRRAVMPLYGPDRKGNPVSVASCLLFKLGGAHFVVSAGHAVPKGADAEGKSVFFLEGERPLTPFASGPWIHTTCGSEGGDRDPYDLAFVRLKPADASRIDTPLFLTAANLAPPMLPDIGSKYMILGYPSNQQRRSLPHKTYRVVPWALGAPEAPEEAYAELETLGINRATHLLVRFDQERPMDWSGNKRPPKPAGMSGGGVWLLGNGFERITADTLPKLQGMLIEYRPRPNPVVVAVRIGVIVALMCRTYPELEPIVRPLVSRADLF